MHPAGACLRVLLAMRRIGHRHVNVATSLRLAKRISVYLSRTQVVASVTESPFGRFGFDELNEEFGVALHLSVQIRGAVLSTVAQVRVVLPFQHCDSTNAEVITVLVKHLEERGDLVSGAMSMPVISAGVVDPLLQVTSGGGERSTSATTWADGRSCR